MPKLTIEERRQKNIDEGRPANCFFRWNDEDNVLLEKYFNAGLSASDMADKLERAPLAIALQLNKIGLTSVEPE